MIDFFSMFKGFILSFIFGYRHHSMKLPWMMNNPIIKTQTQNHFFWVLFLKKSTKIELDRYSKSFKVKIEMT